VHVDIPGVTVSGTLLLQINQSSQAVNELFEVGDTSVLLNLPAGPYIKVAGLNLDINILGQVLQGDFSFIYNQTAGEVQIDVANAFMGIGDGDSNFVSVSIASGHLSIGSQGVSGTLNQATVSVNIPDVVFVGTFNVAIDTQAQFFRIEGGQDTGNENDLVSLSIAGQTLKAAFVIEKSTAADGSAVVRLAGGVGSDAKPG